MFENLTPAEYQVLLRQDFVSFAARCFQDLNPQAELAMNWHLEVIAAKLTAASSGRPRHRHCIAALGGREPPGSPGDGNCQRRQGMVRDGYH
jgi:hypothetical protein